MAMENNLVNLKPNQRCKILRLEGGSSFQRKLNVMGIREGKIVKVITLQPYGPFVIQIEDREMITLGRKMAQKIIVDVIE